MLEKYLKKLRFYDETWFQFVLFVIRRFEADRCREQAGSLTYTTLFAVVPMLTVFLVIISSIKALEPARQQLQQLIYSNFLPKTTIAFDKAFNAFTDKSSNLTVIGILFLFITTVMMLTSIETVFNRIWRVRETRGGIIGFMRYWTIISLGPILLGSAFVISSAVASLNVLSNNFTGYEVDGSLIFWCISFALTILGFFILNWTIPNRSVPIKAALIAGTFSAVVFELLKHLFGFIMSNFTSYEIIYGAFAAVPIFLLWIFLSWNIVLLGVEISYALTAFHSSKLQKRHPVILLLDLLELFYKKQQVGESLSDEEALEVLGRGEIGRWPSYVLM
ncbi:MAG: YihY family inner membrane protein, partial [Acinetobacter sp.]